jgi:hypothetical protein
VTVPQGSSTHQGASPTKTANIRVRRSNHGSTLLQSPARAGYASRMRQMFEEAGRSSTLYSQLPNISRKVSSPSIRSPVQNGIVQQATTSASTKYRLESLCLSMTLPLHVPSRGRTQPKIRHPSERSSGSWSDDSGYIVTQPRERICSLNVPLNERIHTWLVDVPDREGEFPENDFEMTAPCWLSLACSSEWHDEATSTPCESFEKNQSEACPTSTDLEASRTQMPGLQSVLNDPLVCKNKAQRSQAPTRSHMQGDLPAVAHIEDCTRKCTSSVCKQHNFDDVNQFHTPTLKHQLDTSPQHHGYSSRTPVYPDEAHDLEEGGIKLSPLSPNVCIERGPSRYHSNRKPVNTPCNVRPAMQTWGIQGRHVEQVQACILPFSTYA